MNSLTDKILTISIAAYNVEKYIEETLSSLVNSDSLNLLDIIVVNDGSTDRTPDIVQDYVNKYPESITLVNKENGGYGSTINAALSIAKGKYIKLLDGDDWYETKNISLFVQFLKDSSADIVLTQFKRYNISSNHLIEIKELIYTNYELLDVSNLSEMWMYSLAVKTELIKDKVSITEHCYYTDVEWWMKCVIHSNNFISIPIPLYCYRVGLEEQSTSDLGYLKHIDEHCYISKNAVIMFNENKCFKGFEKQISRIHLCSYLYLLKSKRTFKNLKSLFSFRRFIIKNAPYAKKYMSTMIYRIYSCPILQLLPYSLLMFMVKIFVKSKRLLFKKDNETND